MTNLAMTPITHYGILVFSEWKSDSSTEAIAFLDKCMNNETVYSYAETNPPFHDLIPSGTFINDHAMSGLWPNGYDSHTIATSKVYSYGNGVRSYMHSWYYTCERCGHTEVLSINQIRQTVYVNIMRIVTVFTYSCSGVGVPKPLQLTQELVQPDPVPAP